MRWFVEIKGAGKRETNPYFRPLFLNSDYLNFIIIGLPNRSCFLFCAETQLYFAFFVKKSSLTKTRNS